MGFDMEHMYTPQQRIEQAKVALFRHPKFAHMAGLFMIGQTTITRDIPTAQTDGRNVLFNPEFVQSLTDAELRGLIYHEYGGHILYQHLTTFRRFYELDPAVANKACDYVINQSIKDFDIPEFMKLPNGGLQDDRFRGMDSKQVFDILRAEGTDTEDSGGEGEGFDSHDWEGAQATSSSEREQLTRDITQAMRQGVMASQLLGNAVDRDACEWLSPQVDWREALRDFMNTWCVGDDYSTYRKPRRRMMASDVYLPTSMSNSLPTVVVAVDTSWSISDEIIGAFLGEVADMCDTVHPECLHVMYWGTIVAGHETYDRQTMLALRESTKPQSGGGTDVNCVTQYLQDNNITPTCVVVLTDGYLAGDWGQWSCPVLWAITTDRVAEVGTTVRLTM
jgi:predicted metal-dependent peptidase